MVDRPMQEVGQRPEVRVKNRDQLTSCRIKSGLQGAGFETLAMTPVTIFHRISPSRPAFDRGAGHAAGFVGRVVENLNLKPIPRVVQTARGVQQFLHDELFVVERELHRHGRKFGEARGRFSRRPVTMPVVEIDQLIAMQPVRAEREHRRQVQGGQAPVE